MQHASTKVLADTTEPATNGADVKDVVKPAAEPVKPTDWKREVCERNGHTWVLGHNAYKMTDDPTQFDEPVYTNTNRGFHEVKPGFFVEDSQQRGFVLVSPMGDEWFELYFALVDAEHRRQGILRAMVDEVVNRLPNGSILWLECREEDAPCWRALNFSPAKERLLGPADGCDHEFKLVVAH